MTDIEYVLGNQGAIVRLWVGWVRSTADSDGVGRLDSLNTALVRSTALEEYREKLLAALVKKWTPEGAAALAAADLVSIDASGPLRSIQRAAEDNRATVLAWLRRHDERPSDVDESAWRWATQLAPELYRQSSHSPWLVS